MSILIVVGYQDIHKAEEVRLQLGKLQRDYLLDLEDAVVVVKNDKGKVKVQSGLQPYRGRCDVRRFLGLSDWVDVPESAPGLGRGCISGRGFRCSHRRRHR